jgi:microcin C transport system substrate-binding protein
MPVNFLRCLLFTIISLLLSHTALAEDESIIETHGFALYGDLKYPADFTHFDFVNPDAPKGGTLRLMGFGAYDSLNPYTLKGISPINTPGQFMFGFSELNETLLIGTGDYSSSADETQSAYGLLAERIRYPANIAWVEFDLRTNSFFHDGHPVDAQDVVFSYDTLLKKGHPRFQQMLLGVQSVSVIAPRTVRFTFKETQQRANILRAGELPVLPEHFWKDKDFERSSEIVPLLSGPYDIADFKIGQQITLKRRAEFWAKDLNVYRGRYNFDQVIIDYYRDQTVAFEAFKAGRFDLFYDYTAKNWAMSYDFPAVKDGRVVKEEIQHKIPSPTQAFFFNTRREIFQDVRVRQALSLLFDFEWTNKSLFNDAYTRNLSYFPNSDFQATGLPSKAELDLLEPFKSKLPDALFTQAFALPVTQGDGNIRQQMKAATELLNAAGWQLDGSTLKHKDSGKAFEFEVLIRQAGIQRVILPFIKNLERLGIKVTPRLIDTAQYKVRVDQFDFDMTTVSLSQGHAPSYEQRDYYHSSTSQIEGSQNYAGIRNEVVDHLIEQVLKATTKTQLETAMQALDRVLLWSYYTIPNWHLNYHRLASWQKFERPIAKTPYENLTPYKLGVENWWMRQDEK